MIATALTAFGVGLASGQRGALTAFLIGAAHHSPWFSLGTRWEWLASPAVLAICCVVGVVEILADRMPESSEWVDIASWLPKAVVGFIAVAATMGTVDQSVMALAGSGMLGATLAVGTDRLRVAARRTTRDLADGGASGVDRAVHHGETLSAAGLTLAALAQPWMVILVLFAVVGFSVVIVGAARAAKGGATRLFGLESGDSAAAEGQE
jgi:hypothetical protein